eukprot:3085351-Prymnesium_polylepis.1
MCGLWPMVRHKAVLGYPALGCLWLEIYDVERWAALALGPTVRSRLRRGAAHVLRTIRHNNVHLLATALSRAELARAPGQPLGRARCQLPILLPPPPTDRQCTENLTSPGVPILLLASSTDRPTVHRESHRMARGFHTLVVPWCRAAVEQAP